jgi:hypothetical protein
VSMFPFFVFFFRPILTPLPLSLSPIISSSFLSSSSSSFLSSSSSSYPLTLIVQLLVLNALMVSSLLLLTPSLQSY